jgi:hypothetical protein
MQRARRHAVEIALVGDGAVLEHDEAVRVGLVEQRGERGWTPFAVFDRQCIEVAFVGLEPAAVAAAAPHLDRRNQLADVLEGPAVPRRPVPVEARHHHGRR